MKMKNIILIIFTLIIGVAEAWAETITVTFNPNGGNFDGSTNNEQIVETIGEVYVLPSEPTRIGYTFAGWFTDATGGTQVHSGTTVESTEEPTLYAHWTVNTYTVTLNMEGGSGGTAEVTTTYGQDMPSATGPTRTGYSFEGYFTEENVKYYNANMTSARIWDRDPYPTNDDLYAHWTANTYTVTFDAQNGSVSPTSQSATYDAKYGTLPTPTRYGFEFNGWYTSENTLVDASMTYNIADNQTLYAHWNTTTVNNDFYSTETSLANFYFCTFFDSQVAYVLPTGITAYKGKTDGSYLVLTAIDAKDGDGNNVIPKNVPVILRMEPNNVTSETVSGFTAIQKKTIILTTSEYNTAFDNSNNDLQGTEEEITNAPANSYIFSFGTKGLGFYRWLTSQSLAAHKAYITKGSSAKALTLRFEDDVTGINENAITDFETDASEVVIHSLNGIRLSKPQKGINIINGNKVWVK